MKIRLDFAGQTKLFQDPIQLFVSTDLSTIESNLKQIEIWVKQGYYAVGYLSYESASAFNPFNQTKRRADSDVPLLLFGIFKTYQQVQTNHHIGIGKNHVSLNCNTSQQEYNHNIAHIRQQIEQGNTYQTNYTVQFNGRFDGDAATYYDYLQSNNRADYCAYIEYLDWRILSISPELFFKLDKNTITTKPMKGTTARGRNTVEDALQLKQLFSEKNQAENMMIVDLLRNDLSRISQTGTVEVTQLFTAEKYPTVWQLTSTIQSQLKAETSLFQLFQALFPCGSITGAPKASTMQLIAETEKTTRGIYCGTIGYIAPNLATAMFNIPIRTLTIKGEQASYGVGGGITWDSTDTDEYDEVLQKTAILHSDIGLPEYLIESLLLDHGELFLLDMHLARLADSADYFSISFEQAALNNALIELAQSYPNNRYKIRIQLYLDGQFTIEAVPILNEMLINCIELAENCVDSRNIYLYHKTSNRSHFPTLKAGQELVSFNEKDEITEFVNGNIVLLIDNQWLTPKLDAGVLAGTMRQFYLEQKTISEQTLLLTDLLKAEKIAFINSVREWVAIDNDVFEQLKVQVRIRNQ